jgi:hypothetical protein
MSRTAENNGDRGVHRESPDCLTPHERLRELTAILASGIHRLKACRRPDAGGLYGMTPASPEWGQIPGGSSQTGLEAVTTSRPYGTGRQPDLPVRVRLPERARSQTGTQTGRTPEA